VTVNTFNQSVRLLNAFVFRRRDRIFPIFLVWLETSEIVFSGIDMSTYAPSTANTYAAAGNVRAPRVDESDSYTCPLCGLHGLIRIRRRPIDRLLSLFVRQRRFRCTQPGCAWQGNLHEKTARKQV
jgi:hypothetical protein